MPMGEITLDEQLQFAEAAAARTKAYWNRALTEERSRANPVYAATEIRRADAVVATLRRLVDEARRG